MSVFVLDSNFFIEAHRVSYPLDIMHSFWEKVNELAHYRKIVSIDKVREELYNKNDELVEWCKNNLPYDFFKPTDEVMPQYEKIIEWVKSRNDPYKKYAVDEFLDATKADAFLVAYCLVDSDNRILVTHEISESKRRNKVKIPDACEAVNVRCVNPMNMLRELRETI